MKFASVFVLVFTIVCVISTPVFTVDGKFQIAFQFILQQFHWSNIQLTLSETGTLNQQGECPPGSDEIDVDTQELIDLARKNVDFSPEWQSVIDQLSALNAPTTTICVKSSDNDEK